LRRFQDLFDAGPVQLFDPATVDDLENTIVKMGEMRRGLKTGQEESKQKLEQMVGRVEIAAWLAKTDKHEEGFLRK
jgi:hypothetical protein